MSCFFFTFRQRRHGFMTSIMRVIGRLSLMMSSHCSSCTVIMPSYILRSARMTHTRARARTQQTFQIVSSSMNWNRLVTCVFIAEKAPKQQLRIIAMHVWNWGVVLGWRFTSYVSTRWFFFFTWFICKRSSKSLHTRIYIFICSFIPLFIYLVWFSFTFIY